jgi:hypothetical protein
MRGTSFGNSDVRRVVAIAGATAVVMVALLLGNPFYSAVANTKAPSGSNLTFESEAGFPPHWSRASLAHANRNFHHSQAQ